MRLAEEAASPIALHNASCQPATERRAENRSANMAGDGDPTQHREYAERCDGHRPSAGIGLGGRRRRTPRFLARGARGGQNAPPARRRRVDCASGRVNARLAQLQSLPETRLAGMPSHGATSSPAHRPTARCVH